MSAAVALVVNSKVSTELVDTTKPLINVVSRNHFPSNPISSKGSIGSLGFSQLENTTFTPRIAENRAANFRTAELLLGFGFGLIQDSISSAILRYEFFN